MNTSDNKGNRFACATDQEAREKSLKLDEKFVGHVLAIYIPLTKIGIPRLLGRGFTVKRNKTPFSL